jgi:hypothetical protein
MITGAGEKKGGGGGFRKKAIKNGLDWLLSIMLHLTKG